MSAPPPLLPDNEISRRDFLKLVTGIFGSAIALVLGGAGTGYFLSPLFRRTVDDWIDIGGINDFKPGVPTKVEYNERRRDAWVVTERRSSAWVLTSNNRDFIVFDPRCTHLGCPFRWSDEKRVFLCPCHNGVFNVDGSVESGPPPRALDRYPVKVVGSRLSILPQPKIAAEMA